MDKESSDSAQKKQRRSAAGEALQDGGELASPPSSNKKIKAHTRFFLTDNCFIKNNTIKNIEDKIVLSGCECWVWPSRHQRSA